MSKIKILPAHNYRQCQCCRYEDYDKRKVFEIDIESSNITTVIGLCDVHLKELKNEIDKLEED